MFTIRKNTSGGVDMWCSEKDTVEFNISDFPEGSILEFVISAGEDTEPIIKNEYLLSGSKFLVTLSQDEKKKLAKGEYIQRITITTAEGKIYTQTSGEFIVDWGVRYE